MKKTLTFTLLLGAAASAWGTAPESDVPVETRPAGSCEVIERSSVGYEAIFGTLDTYSEPGLAVEKITGDDGRVWMSNPLSRYPLPSYFYAVAEGDVLTVPAGQCVGSAWNDSDEMVPAYLAAVRFKDDDYGGWCYPCEDPDFRLVVKGDRMQAEDESICLGLCSYNASKDRYEWLGYADRYIVYSPNEGRLVEAPEGEATRWALTTPDGTGYFVDVMQGDDAVYVKGIYSNLPDSWVRLDVEGEKAVMHSGQYLGLDTNQHFAYASGGYVEEWYDEDWDEYFDVAFPAETLEFAYDSEARVLDATGGALLIATSTVPARVDTYIADPVIRRQQRLPGTPPANPVITSYWEYEEEYGNGALMFDLPCVDTDGCLLDTRHLYWRFWVDEELYEFERGDEYWNLPEETMTMIPWGFTAYGNFFAVGISHAVTFYFTGFDSLGVQSVYLDPELDGEMVKSDVMVGVVTGAGASSPEADEADLPVYNLQGMRVMHPGKGIYIVGGKKKLF